MTVKSNNNQPKKQDQALRDGFQWYWEALEQKYDYIVGMTRRCPNWIEAFSAIVPECRVRFNQLITENALLMETEKLVDHYVRTGCFPKVALIDDVLVHGRGLNEFLQSWLELIEDCLRAAGHEADRKALWKAFYESLTIYVYYVNDAPILLKQEYQSGMKFRYIGRESEWRTFSLAISDFIWRSKIANTSYVLSASRGDTLRLAALPASAKWDLVKEDEIPYRGGKQRLYVEKNLAGFGLYATVRSYVRQGVRFFTPYFFCGDLTQEQIDALVVYLKECLRQSGNSCEKFFTLLRRAAAFSGRRIVYFQLVNLLLGQMILSRFLQENGLNPENFTFDTQKIAYNFGIAEEVQPVLEELCAVSWLDGAMEGMIEYLVRESDSKAEVSPGAIREAIEEKVYRQAVEHEAYARELSRQFAAGREGDIRRTGECHFDAFLADILQKLNISSKNDRAAYQAVACLTQMMDRGDVSLKARVEAGEDGRLIYYSSIRNTETSLAIMPMRISPYFRDFFYLAQFFWRDDDFPQRAKKYFTMLFSTGARTTGKLPPEAREKIRSAELFARIISENRDMVSSMMDWREVFPEF